VAQLAQFEFGDYERLENEAGQRVYECAAHKMGLTKPLFRSPFG
jgi:hypothetical protein